MNDERETFTYTYSARQQEKIRNIRQKYLPQEEDKMERLLRLDRSATIPGKVAALTVGVVSMLVFGVGMCCTMVWADRLFVPGILVGLLGIARMLSTHPLYVRITKKRRKKLAPDILRLTNELIR